MGAPEPSTKVALKHPPLSNYGDPENRQHNPFLSVGTFTLIFSVYVFGSLLPVIFPMFCYFGLYLQWVPLSILKLLATVVALDFIIPLDDGYRPKQKRKAVIERLFAEGGQIYFPAKALFLPKNVSKEKAYILAAYPHGLFGGGNHFGLYDFTNAFGISVIYSGASVMKYVPFVRRLLTTLGLTTVDKEGLKRVLDVRKHGPTYPYNVVHLVCRKYPVS